MRALGVFPETREVRLVEGPEPSIASPRDLKLRMIEVGVCGTDRALCAFRFGSAPPGCDHFVLGHESLAEVVEAGDDASAVRPGDLVVATVRRPCGDPRCAPCRAGRQDFCATGLYRERGILGMHGFLAEYVVEEDRYVYRVPPELRDVAVLIEPLTIAEKAFLQFQAIDARLPWRKQRRVALILGAGPIGLLGAMLFRAAGFETWVYSKSRPPAREASIAEAAGARYVSSLEASARDLAAAAGVVDVVYEAMGGAPPAAEVLESLGANGVFVFTGFPARGEPFPLDVHRLLFQMVLRNQVVLGTVNAGPDAFDAATRDLAVFQARWPGALASMITARYPMEAFREAIHEAGIKNVIGL